MAAARAKRGRESPSASSDPSDHQGCRGVLVDAPRAAGRRARRKARGGVDRGF